MKSIFSKWWVFALVFIVAGISLLTVSWALGAGGGYVYIDRNGLHVGQDGEGEYKHLSENSLEEFSSVEVSVISADVEMIASDHYGFEAQLPLEAEDIEWKIEDGKLIIDGQQDWAKRVNLFNLGFWGKDYFVKVYYKSGAELEEISLKSTSGNLKTDAMRCNNLTAETVSGDNMVIVDECGEVTLKSTSGRVSLDADNDAPMKLKMNSISGNVEVKNAKWDSMIAESVSGEVVVSGEAGADTTAKSVSGNVKLMLRGNKKYAYAMTSVSGGIYVNGDRMGSPARSVDDESAVGMVNVSTTSGEIRVEF